MSLSRPVTIGIGGFASNSGKTTLLCELLKLFPGWEAIKTTKGHYRSCGKDPHSCCVSHLLSDAPVVNSGREATYAPGKDTGRYWDAGAVNVHWVIADEDQIGKGIVEALSRVHSSGVFVEGNSFSEFVKVDLMFMIAAVAGRTIKKSARRALPRASRVVLTTRDFSQVQASDREEFNSWLSSLPPLKSASLPGLCSWQDTRLLADEIQKVQCSIAGSGGTNLVAAGNGQPEFQASI